MGDVMSNSLFKQLSGLAAAGIAAAGAGGRNVCLLLTRCLFNAMKAGPTRKLLTAPAVLPELITQTAQLLAFPDATVKFAACVLLQNICNYFVERSKDALEASTSVAGAGAAGSSSASFPAAEDVQTVLQLVMEALDHAKAGNSLTVAEEDPNFKLLVCLGSIACLSRAYASAAKKAGAEDRLQQLAAKFPGSASIKEASTELRGMLATA